MGYVTVLCHHCNKRVRISKAGGHWRECPDSPARKVVEEQAALLLKIGWVLGQPCWRTYGALATLHNDIKNLIGE